MHYGINVRVGDAAAVNMAPTINRLLSIVFGLNSVFFCLNSPHFLCVDTPQEHTLAYGTAYTACTHQRPFSLHHLISES